MKITGEEFDYKVILHLDAGPDVVPGTGLHFTRPTSTKYRCDTLVIRYRRECGEGWACSAIAAEGPIYKKDGTLSQVIGTEEWRLIGRPGELDGAPEFIRDLVKQYTPEG